MGAYGPGGLDLAALAQQATGETQQRVAGGQSHLAASLASMLQELQGGFAAKGEAQGRDQVFERAQAMLQERMAQREQNMSLAEQAARAQASSSGGGGSGQPNWYEQQMFATNENIRQAKALRAMDLQDKAAADKQADIASTPSLAQFVGKTIAPDKGYALANSKTPVSKGKWGDRLAAGKNYISDKDRAATNELVSLYARDPVALDRSLRDYFGAGQLGANRASYALYDIGYGTGLLGGG
jgi:hypothetical protein